MTKLQHGLLKFIESFIATYGYAPSFTEMKVGMGLSSKSAVHRLLRCLEEQGKIIRMRHRSRAIEIVPSGRIPPQLSGFSTGDLAREAKRRHLVLGHIHQTLERDEAGNVIGKTRSFHEIAL